MQNKPSAIIPAVALANFVDGVIEDWHRVRAYLFDKCTDFCRWRSRCAAKRAGRAIACGRRWLDRESNLIKHEMERQDGKR